MFRFIAGESNIYKINLKMRYHKQ